MESDAGDVIPNSQTPRPVFDLEAYQRCHGMSEVLPMLEKACSSGDCPAKSDLVEFMVLGRDQFLDRWKQSIDILGIFMALILSGTVPLFISPPDVITEDDWRL